MFPCRWYVITVFIPQPFLEGWTLELFKDVPFIPYHDTITCDLWTCLLVDCSKQVFLDHSTTSPLLLLPQLVWNMLPTMLAEKTGNNILDFYLKHKIIRLVYCVLSNTVSMLFLEEVWLCRHYSGACVKRGEGKNWLKWFSILIDISVVPSMLKCQLRWQTLHLLNIGVLARSLWACC